MAENFYYLASYTAAMAAGFAAADALAIARAARYVEDCEDFTVPKKDAPQGPEALKEALRIWPIFHYLPGDPEELAKDVNPAVLSSGTPELLYGLPLVCRPGGRLIHMVIGRARKIWAADGPRGERLQAAGIALHTLADTFMHQGFAGLPAPTVNAAGTVLVSGAVPRDQVRQRLAAALAGSLETAFDLKPFTPEQPPAGALGCEQLGGLTDRPGAVYTYLSSWALIPLTACVNPLRFAAAYRTMREALRFIRSAQPSFEAAGPADQAGLLDLAGYFASVQEDGDLPSTWSQQFDWLPRPQDYRAPTYEADEPYIRSFKLQAMAQRDLVMDACPLLGDCAKLLAAPESA